MKRLLACLAALGLAACGDSGGNTVYDAAHQPIDAEHLTPDAEPPIDGGIDAPPPIDATPPDADCVTNPVTSQQLLNACTTADRVTNNPTTGCWYADGGLPPLP